MQPRYHARQMNTEQAIQRLREVVRRQHKALSTVRRIVSYRPSRMWAVAMIEGRAFTKQARSMLQSLPSNEVLLEQVERSMRGDG